MCGVRVKGSSCRGVFFSFNFFSRSHTVRGHSVGVEEAAAVAALRAVSSGRVNALMGESQPKKVMRTELTLGRRSQGLVYGKCIGARYTDVERGMCDKEFQSFKKCMLDVVSAIRRENHTRCCRRLTCWFATLQMKRKR